MVVIYSFIEKLILLFVCLLWRHKFVCCEAFPRPCLEALIELFHEYLVMSIFGNNADSLNISFACFCLSFIHREVGKIGNS